jgi:hypothetical protein
MFAIYLAILSVVLAGRKKEFEIKQEEVYLPPLKQTTNTKEELIIDLK